MYSMSAGGIKMTTVNVPFRVYVRVFRRVRNFTGLRAELRLRKAKFEFCMDASGCEVRIRLH